MRISSAEYKPALGVVQVGVEVCSDFSTQSTRIYRHAVPNSSMVLQDGATIFFYGGYFATANKSIQDQLDAIADRGTGVFRESKIEKDPAQLAAVRDAQGVVGTTAPAPKV